jgi:hypothetical protein
VSDTRTSTTACTTDTVITPEAIERTLRLVREFDPWASTADSMREKGFDPAAGCILAFPATWRPAYGEVPAWVRFSDLVSTPVMMRAGALG